MWPMLPSGERNPFLRKTVGGMLGTMAGNAAEREPAAIVRDSTFDFLARYLCK